MDRILAELVPENEALCGEHIRNLFFGNYMEPDADVRIYNEVILFLNSEYHLSNIF